MRARQAVAVAIALVAFAFPNVAAARAEPSKAPPGASAQCRDGTYSFSHHRRGTCSHHSGVRRWLRVVAP
jgi:hypothetical protein